MLVPHLLRQVHDPLHALAVRQQLRGAIRVAVVKPMRVLLSTKVRAVLKKASVDSRPRPLNPSPQLDYQAGSGFMLRGPAITRGLSHISCFIKSLEFTGLNDA